MKIGIIAGSGMNDPTIIQNRTEKKVTTPYGDPSDSLIIGEIAGVQCVFIPRHGLRHSIVPCKVNYRANLWAFKQEGCTHVLACTACGGLQEHTQPGDFVVLDQFIDRTRVRHQTFYDNEPGHLEGVLHIPMAQPFCHATRSILIDAALATGGKLVNSSGSSEAGDFRIHEKGTIVTIEGPRFSSQAESIMFHQWGFDVINMTTVPEVMLAKELGLCYAAIAMVTDYDSWHPVEESVSVNNVLETFRANSHKMKAIFAKAVPLVAAKDWSEILKNNLKIILDSRQDLAATHPAPIDSK